MYKNIEQIYLNLQVWMSWVFEAMTCRTKPGYQQCDLEEGYVECSN